MVNLSAIDLAVLSLQPPGVSTVQLRQTEHRISLVSKWNIPEGATILEIGCGQGDCTVVLAEAVGPNGHVTAIDPAPLTYGSPFTLGQAQDFISAGRLGGRITWTQADPLSFLTSQAANGGPKYDFVVLAHCLWYFPSPSQIWATLQIVAQRTRKICIAEWSLFSSEPAGAPHVLAALTQAALECHKIGSQSNVRTVVSPTSIKEFAAISGWRLESESSVSPGAGVLDGKWETEAVMNPEFIEEIEKCVEDERAKNVVFALRDATAASLERVGEGVKGVVPMDVWCAVFTLND